MSQTEVVDFVMYYIRKRNILKHSPAHRYPDKSQPWSMWSRKVPYQSYIYTVPTRPNLTPQQTHLSPRFSFRVCFLKICICSGFTMGILSVYYGSTWVCIWGQLYTLKCEAELCFILTSVSPIPLYIPNTYVEIFKHFPITIVM